MGHLAYMLSEQQHTGSYYTCTAEPSETRAWFASRHITELSLRDGRLARPPGNILLDHLIRAARAGEGVGFGFENEAHAHDIPHGLAQRVVAPKAGVRIDVGVDFHVYSIECEQAA